MIFIVLFSHFKDVQRNAVPPLWHSIVTQSEKEPSSSCYCLYVCTSLVIMCIVILLLFQVRDIADLYKSSSALQNLVSVLLNATFHKL